jgi:hypothetical protein
MVHTCYLSTRKSEIRCLQVQGQFGLHSKTLFQKNTKTKQKRLGYVSPIGSVSLKNPA